MSKNDSPWSTPTPWAHPPPTIRSSPSNWYLSNYLYQPRRRNIPVQNKLVFASFQLGVRVNRLSPPLAEIRVNMFHKVRRQNGSGCSLLNLFLFVFETLSRTRVVCGGEFSGAPLTSQFLRGGLCVLQGRLFARRPAREKTGTQRTHRLREGKWRRRRLRPGLIQALNF